jgi:glycosyltransferase involved in cell wall biosynthesis
MSAGRGDDDATNLAALDRAAESLPWPVFIASDTADGSPSWAAARPVRLDSADEMALAMGRAAIYALPARYEPSGLPAMEAALSGCALVLGDLPNHRELWENAAVFVPPDDDRALADALQWLIAHPAGRERLAREARASAVHRPIASMADDYLGCYHTARSTKVA